MPLLFSLKYKIITKDFYIESIIYIILSQNTHTHIYIMKKINDKLKCQIIIY